jgi:RHS repeat-associated protein
MTFSLYGLTTFQAQYWNGSAWTTAPNGNITANNLVWKQITFSTISTTKIRTWITGSSDGYSRMAEVEAWGVPTGSSSTSNVEWLITDHLGTPRMVLDQTGSLTALKRHDYLPFGEELFAPTSGRTAAQGYASDDGVRQHFTAKERDVETGLDYFGARYYASIQGRFTAADPLLSSGRSLQPQSWNRYSYVVNRPLSVVDPNGLDWGVATWQEADQMITEYRWFNGKIGKKGARYGDHSYSAVKFGNNGRGSLDVSDDAGNLIRISNYGIVRQVVYTGPGGDGPSNGQGSSLNASAGMVDAAFPFGKQIREAAFGKMGVDTNAPEYQNASTISGGVTTGVLFLTEVGEAELAEEGTTTLDRAVGQAEYEQIMKTGTFEAGANSLGENGLQKARNTPTSGESC